MTLAPSLRVGVRQRAVLAPALRGALSVLRMPLAELQAEIARELADNPFLRRHRGPRGEAELPLALAATETPLERLRAQIGLMPLAPDVRAMAEHLAAELREDGYLETPLTEIAAELGVPLALAEAGLAAVQGCEPAGVGARNLTECLTLQLIDRGVERGLAAATVARLEAFVAGNWRELGRELGLPRPELERIAALLPALVAHPLSPAAPALPLLPDLVAEPRAGGGHDVRLAREAAPRLSLDVAMLARAGDEPFARDCRARAEALIAAVAARGTTLERIGAHLAEAQAAAFAHGPEHLRPLTRAEVAAALGLHASTVGRAVADKAIAIDARVVPLSQFFASAVPQAEGAALAGLALRRRIARMIAAEPPAAPLSDEAIRQALAAEGIDIARRTVAKYREWMRLPSSHQRRRLARLRGALAGR